MDSTEATTDSPQVLTMAGDYGNLSTALYTTDGWLYPNHFVNVFPHRPRLESNTGPEASDFSVGPVNY